MKRLSANKPIESTDAPSPDRREASDHSGHVGYARYAGFVLVFNLLVILVGTVVRATRSGDGCGSHWPECNGVFLPVEPSVRTIIEFTHRVVSGLDGLFVLALVAGAFLFFPRGGRVRYAAIVTLFLTLVEAWLGAYLVKKGLVAGNATMARVFWMSLHLCNTFFLLTAVTLTAWWATGRARLSLKGQGSVLWAIALALLALLALGVSGAITALGDTLYPARSHEEVMALARQADAPALLKLRIWHPYIAGSVGLYLILIAGLVSHLRPSSDSRRFGQTVGWLFVAQVCVGLLNVWLKAPVVMQVVHLLFADFVWISVVCLSASALALGVPKVEAIVFTADGPRSVAETAALPVMAKAGFSDYLAITKPRVISLLLFTTLTALCIASGGWPGGVLFTVVALGGFLSAGAANALNMVIDRDIDARMKRTAKRPTVTRAIPTPNALSFALLMALGSFLVLWLGANLLAAMMSLAGLVFYVVVYTLLLKRRTTQNIVIGGAAGCFPPLVGWAAATGDLKGALAWYLFAIIFVWTPAHFWALALLIKDDYAEVGIPMLPAVVGDKATVAQILVYTAITVAVSLGPWAQGLTGLIYAVSALLLNGLLVLRSAQLFKNTDRPRALSMYKYSMLYLALLFFALTLDRAWHL